MLLEAAIPAGGVVHGDDPLPLFAHEERVAHKGPALVPQDLGRSPRQPAVGGVEPCHVCVALTLLGALRRVVEVDGVVDHRVLKKDRVLRRPRLVLGNYDRVGPLCRAGLEARDENDDVALALLAGEPRHENGAVVQLAHCRGVRLLLGLPQERHRGALGAARLGGGDRADVLGQRGREVQLAVHHPGAFVVPRIALQVVGAALRLRLEIHFEAVVPSRRIEGRDQGAALARKAQGGRLEVVGGRCRGRRGHLGLCGLRGSCRLLGSRRSLLWTCHIDATGTERSRPYHLRAVAAFFGSRRLCDWDCRHHRGGSAPQLSTALRGGGQRAWRCQLHCTSRGLHQGGLASARTRDRGHEVGHLTHPDGHIVGGECNDDEHSCHHAVAHHHDLPLAVLPITVLGRSRHVCPVPHLGTEVKVVSASNPRTPKPQIQEHPSSPSDRRS
mmetsp:Transcript_63756/g.201647  ORF Transcript_63756/g.201647 Transcript_63756/m.201647 type:complete len:443 (+) Transcript_63756:594-1922(+)